MDRKKTGAKANVTGTRKEGTDKKGGYRKKTGKNVKQGDAIRRNYKDSLFCMVFKEKKELLSLYNAVNGTSYTDVDDLTVNTLENAIYMNMKNDISCLVENHMDLYEQQSTYCPNMPMRELMYVSRLYEKELRGRNLYSSSLVKIPTPKFVVLYNGTRKLQERQVLKLSDAFMVKEGEPDLELKVTVLNINPGMNEELLKGCKTLRDYVAYVEKVRGYSKNMPTEEAVELAVRECIRNDILAEFLKKYRAEAVQVSIFEYDQEMHMRCIAEEAREEGRREERQNTERERQNTEIERRNAERERRNTEIERRKAQMEQQRAEKERERAEKAEWELKELKRELAMLKGKG